MWALGVNGMTKKLFLQAIVKFILGIILFAESFYASVMRLLSGKIHRKCDAILMMYPTNTVDFKAFHEIFW